MKTIKTLLIFCLILLGFQQANAQLNAEFSYMNYNCDSVLQFQPLYSNPNLTEYVWDFGDGTPTVTTLYNQIVFHTYANFGNYIVTRTASFNGQTTTYTLPVVFYIEPNNIWYQTTGNISCNNTTLTLVGFEDNPNNPIIEWSWNISWVSSSVNFNDTTSTISYLFDSQYEYGVGLSGLDSGHCIHSFGDSIIFSSPLTASPTYNIINEDCQAALVNLFANASGGTPPYSYQWNWYDFGNSTDQNPQNALIMNSIDPGVYLTITDANGCTFSTQILIPYSGASIFGNVSTTPSSSCGSSCDGNITVSATGGQGPYSFYLSNGNTQTGYQTTFNNLCEGQYTVTIYDQSQCSQTYTAYVQGDSLSQIIVDAVAYNGSACNILSVCQGSIDAYAFGGTAPYQYSIDGGATYQSSSSFTSVCPGTYIVEAQDAAGCSNVYTVVVGAPDSIALTPYEYYANCQNSTGQSVIGVSVQGGSGNYTYTWSDGSDSSAVANPTPGTTYSVIVDDGNGCTASETFNVPTNDCYTISGHVYVDVNGNCVYDSTDYPLSCWVDLTATAGGPWLWIYDYTDANGYYEISTNAGTYFFDINGYNTNGLNLLCPNANYSVTLNQNNQTANVDFFLSPPAPVQDLSISIGHITNVAPSTIPSHNRWSYIEFCNDGTYPMSGYAEWNYSSELTYAGPPSWSTIFPDVVDQANHTLTFNFTNLQPGQCKYIRINFDVPNTLPIGTVIDDEAVVYPIAGDVTPANNTAYTSVLSEGSWDPNDKSVYPNGDITVDDNDHNYHIRFQNEGNANATRVIVKDELDSDLALHSLRNVSASHDYIMTVENNNTLVFTFNNIQLPPKDVDEAASQGWVNFTISQDGEKPVGTEIENTAAIYFDFNEAVITNTVVNTIVEKVSGIQDAELLNAVAVYPNPSKGVYNVSIDKNLDVQGINVYDVVGNKILTMPEIGSNQIQVNLQNSPAGIYLLEIITVDSKASTKLIKQ